MAIVSYLPTTSVELCSTESSMFRCVDCNFNIVRLLCWSLPRAITLVDSVVEDYCCDICESETNPRTCVYYCQECRYGTLSYTHLYKIRFSQYL
ncbi:hypothetical protein PanWU01x14_272940 [Parasponia andersonii]|uniref:Uncharacterized protein n=1 Tax=Parasponia andersonii TaxID=3476 RepID=A0A2P5B423_PARAD|nr:hypothetical protein PanWU01x14_272940 [Parasponia andersonii]